MKTRKSTRMQTRESKRRKLNNSSSMPNTNNTCDLVDRMSDLHDSILSIILSCLPTKNAVATSILSKRWKSAWMTVHNLDFCLWNGDGVMYGDDENMMFIQFVNRVLLLHDGRSLNKFRLVWEPSFIPSQVCSWITTAITKNVHELYLFVDQTTYDPMELPVSLFSCDSLQYLELMGSISFSDAITVVCLPRLETLELVSVSFKSEEAFENLISGCPMLSYLHLDMGTQRKESYSGDFFMYIISSTSLRRLHLHVDNSHDYSHYGLRLEASSLEYLKLSGFIAQVCVPRGTLSSLVEAHFGIAIYEDEYSEDTCNSVIEALRAFHCAKALTLSKYAMLALSKATIPLSTKFKRLTKLEAETFSCYSWLQDFIQYSDSLEVLTIEQNFGKGVVHPKWTAPVEVPKCLSNSLKVVEFKGYDGCDAEHEMIGYMLRYGSALEVIQLTSYLLDGEEVNLELVKKIRRFPRKSPACKVELSGTHCPAWRTCPFP